MKKEVRKQHLIDAYRELIQRADYLEFIRLRANSSLSRFSLNNLSLLMFEAWLMERPLPTMLHTYKDWLALGRQVQRGEGGKNAWHVLAPNKRTITDEETGEKRRIITGFHWISEFDVTQTDGEPLPETPADLETDDHFEQLGQLLTWTLWEEGIAINWQPKERMKGAKGWYSRKHNDIVLCEGMAPDEVLAVLIHELIHAGGIGYDNFSRAEAEMICESATAIVCMGIGLEHIEQSLDYIAHWSGTDPERAIMVFERAEKEARRLEKALEKNHERQEVAA